MTASLDKVLRIWITRYCFVATLWLLTIFTTPTHGFALQANSAQQRATLVIDSGHTGFIQQLCMSRDKHYMASVGADRQLLIWDLRSGESQKRYALTSVFAIATTIAFTPDSRYILAAGGDGITRYPVNPSLGLPKKIYKDLAYSITFSPDGKMVAIDGDGQLLIGSYLDGNLDVAPKLKVDTVLGITFSPDSSHVAFVEDGKGVAEITVAHPDPVWLMISTDDIRSLTYADQDRLLVQTSPKDMSGPGVRVVDVRTSTVLYDQKPNCFGDVTFAADGDSFACVVFDPANSNRSLSTFSLADGHVVDVHAMAPRSAIDLGGMPTAFSRDMSVFAYTYSNTFIDVRLLPSWSAVPQHFSGVSHPVRSLEWIPSSPYLAIRGDVDAGFLDGTAGVILPAGNALAGTFDFSVNGRAVAYSCVDSICIQDRQNGSITHVPVESKRVITNVAIAADGNSVMWESVNEKLKDRRLQWWNSESGTKDICAGLGYEGTFQRSPSGLLLISSCHGVKIWRMKDGEIASDLSNAFPGVGPYAISWDDKTVAMQSGYSISIRNIADKSVAATILLRRGGDASLSNLPYVNSLRFEPGGHLLGVVADGGVAHPLPRAVVWDSSTGHELRSIDSFGALFTSIEAAADTGILFVGAEDGFVYLYGPQSDNVLVQIASMGDYGWLAATPDGIFDGTASAFTFARWKIGGRVSSSIDSLYSTYFFPGLISRIIANTPLKSSDLPKISELLASPGIDALLASGGAFLRPFGSHTRLCLPTPSPLILQNLSLTQKGASIAASKLEESYSDDPSCSYSRILPEPIASYELTSASIGQTHSKGDTKNAEAVAIKGRVHVLSIGEGNYTESSGWPTLSAPKVDAIRIIDDMRRLFGSDRVDVDIAPVLDASRTQIYSALLAILPKLKAEDTFVIYLSGHGVVPPGQEMFYFVPIDSPGRSLRDMQESAISTASIVDFVRAVPCRHIVILIDACQSGGALDSLLKIADVKVMLGGRTATPQAGEQSVHVIVSSTSLQSTLTRESLAGASPGGFFLDSLSEALAGPYQSLGDVESAWAKSLLRDSSAIGLPQNLVHFDAGTDLLLSGSSENK